MRTLILTVLTIISISSNTAFACPDLNGSYTCKDETGLVSEITVSQNSNDILFSGEQSDNVTYSLINPTKVALGIGISASVKITCTDNTMTYIGTFLGSEVMRMSHTKTSEGFTSIDPDGMLIKCNRK